MIQAAEPSTPASSAYAEVRTVGMVAVASIDCPFIRDRQASMIEERLGRVLALHGGRLVIDMADVAQVSSAWLGSLLRLADACDKARGRLVVAGASEGVRQAIALVNGTRSFDLAERAEDALRLFEPAHPSRTIFSRLLRAG